ncbi:hypothetical protein RJT34_02087 [Clitoria ternatea]|uniref:ZF-HD dimerization-type domain-containing protein n=1 Tax=Clitoria ternatea TaxID=43366 RepID=A0AAN9KK11_CLITE
MEFPEQEGADLGAIPGASFDDSAFNQNRVKMPSLGEQEGHVAIPQPMTRNNFKGKYKECQKNHAIGLGGHALDGCCEFMPAGPDGTLDALRCAACNCHRNFHRKETDATGVDPLLFPFHPRRHQFAAYYRAPAGYLHVAGQQRVGATLALPSTSAGGGGTQSPKEEHDDVLDHSGGGAAGSKKRFRTKFSQEQKDKMLGFAERLGWKIQKHDENVVEEFCSQAGVNRHVLKVWMHNNKHTLGKKP